MKTNEKAGKLLKKVLTRRFTFEASQTDLELSRSIAMGSKSGTGGFSKCGVRDLRGRSSHGS